MSKVITRSAFRVEITGTLTLPQPDGLRIEVRVTDAVIAPQQLGDFGWVRMSDSLVSRNIEGDYEQRCQEIVRALREQQPGIVRAEIRWDSEELCSHCGLSWEVMTAEVAEKYQDWDDPIGLPQCCDEAQQEWRVAFRAGVA